jgi:predicted RNase H-like HicB family nuclease
MARFKIIVETHPDGYVAYPCRMRGIVVGEGETDEEALVDVRSAIRFHLGTFGAEALQGRSAPLRESSSGADRECCTVT